MRSEEFVERGTMRFKKALHIVARLKTPQNNEAKAAFDSLIVRAHCSGQRQNAAFLGKVALPFFPRKR